MAELYSQYASGEQFTAGTIVGSAMGVSGLNPVVDRLNKAFPEDFEYEWIDTSPNFNGVTYVSDDIWLNQNLSGCKVKGSYYASGTNTITWELYKISGAGTTVNETLLGSIPAGSTNYIQGVTYDTNVGNMITTNRESGTNTDFIRTHSGVSSTFIGSFDSNINLIGGCLDWNTDDSYLLINSDDAQYIYTFSGTSTTNMTSIGSFSISQNTAGIAYIDDTKEIIISDIATNYFYRYSGTSTLDMTLNGSFVGPGIQPTAITYDTSQNNFISMDDVSDFLYVHSGVSTTILGSFALPVGGGDDVDDLAFKKVGTGSLFAGLANGSAIYIYDLGMEIEVLESGLGYNQLYTASTAIDRSTYPKIRLKATKTDSSKDEVNTIVFEYL